MRGSISRRAAPVLAAVLAAVAGCKAQRFDVTGKVSYNGAPLGKSDGQIVFVGPGGEQVAAPIGTDGTYRAGGVASGPNRVAVYYPNPAAKPDKSHKLKPGEAPPAAAPFLTPAKYASVETSELSVTVDKETEFNVDLTGPKVR